MSAQKNVQDPKKPTGRDQKLLIYALHGPA